VGGPLAKCQTITKGLAEAQAAEADFAAVKAIKARSEEVITL
jgi:hypothetical protein